MSKLTKKLNFRLSQFPNQGLIIRGETLWCEFCEKDIFFQKKSTVETHIAGKKHQFRRLDASGENQPWIHRAKGEDPLEGGDPGDGVIAPEAVYNAGDEEPEIDPSKIVREDEVEVEDRSKGRGRKLSSPIWEFFIQDRLRKLVNCKICGCPIKTTAGATVMRNHLRLHRGSYDVLREKLKDMDWSGAKAKGPGRPRKGKAAAVKSEPEPDPESDSDEGSEMGGDDDYDDGGGSDFQMSGGEDDEKAEEEPDMGTSRKLRRTTITISQRGSQPHSGGSCFTCDAKCSSSTPQLGSEEYRFFLMEMLGLPAGKSLSYLEQLGTPEKWMALCKSCQDLIGKSISTRKKIVSLQLQLEKYQGQVLTKMKTNAKTRKAPAGIPKKLGGVVQDIRKFVQSRNFSGQDTDMGFTDDTDASMDIGVADQDEGHSDSDQGPPDLPILDGGDVSDDELDQPVFYCGLCDDDRTYANAKLLAAHTKKSHPSSISTVSSSSSATTPNDQDSSNSKTGTVKGYKGESRRSKLSRVVLCKSYQYRYSCLNCPQVKDYSVIRFIQHLSIHQRRPYQCVLCSQFFPADQQLRDRHWAEQHANVQHSPDADKFVIIKFTPGKIYKCDSDSCLEGFFSDEDRCEHERGCLSLSPEKLRKRASLPPTKQTPFPCKLCELRFRNFAEWRLHRALNHPQEDSMSCYYCHESFCETTKGEVEIEAKHEMRMVNHLKSQHGTTKIFLECEECGIVFNCGKDHNEHMLEHHRIPANQLFPCGLCELKYPDIWTMRRHMSNIHFQSDLLFCELCGSSFIQETSLSQHKFKVHGVVTDGQEVFTCVKEGCGFKSLVKSKVTRHTAQVHYEGLNSFMCRYCGKAFKDRGYCRTHEEIHKNQETKPYHCDICGSSFAVKSYLATHKKLSHGDPENKSPSRKRSRSTVSSIGQDAPPTMSSGYGHGAFNEATFPTSSTTQGVHSHQQEHSQLMNLGFPIYHR